MIIAALCAVLDAFAAVDGVTYRNADSVEDWYSTGSYSSLIRGVWQNALYPRDGGTAVFAATGNTKLKPTSGLQLGAIENRNSANVTLQDAGLTMTGDAPYIQAAYNATFTLAANCPVSGTGANTLTVKTDPGYGFGTVECYNLFSNLGLLDFESGNINARFADGAQTMLTTGPVRLSGAQLHYVGSASAAGGAAAASIATGAGATFTFAPGTAYLRVALGANAASATLTTGPIVRGDGATAELAGSQYGDYKMGVSTFIKTTQTPTLVNGIIGPWLVMRGQNDHAANLDFLTYDAAKGFIPAKDFYTNDLSAGPAAVVAKAGNFTVDTATSVYALRVVNTEASGRITLNADLQVGDGVHPAGMIFNYDNSSSDPGLRIIGTGAIDFGDSEGIIWCTSRNGDGRRSFYVDVPIKSENGVTFAGPAQEARSPIIYPKAGTTAQWKGPLRLRNVRYVVSNQNQLPSPDVYLDGRGLIRGAQLFFQGTALTNHMHIAGNGLQDLTDRAGALNGNAALNGPVTLMHDATAFVGITFNAPITGHGTLTVESDNSTYTHTFNAPNGYDGGTVVKTTTLAIGANGTLGAGPATVGANAVLAFSGVTKSIPNAISGGGTMRLSAATVATTGTNDLACLVFDGASHSGVVGASALTVKNTKVAGVVGAGSVSGADADALLTVTRATDGEFHPALEGTAKLVKEGTASLALFNDSTSSGGITVNGGTLKTVGRIEAPFQDSLVFHLDATVAESFRYAADGVTITNWCSTTGGVVFGPAGGVFTGPTRDVAGWNGKPVVKFDAGASNRLYSVANVTPRTLFFAIRPRPDNMVSCAGLFGGAGTDRNGIRAVTFVSGNGSWTWDSSVASAALFDPDGHFIIDGGQAGYREISNGQPQVLVAEKSDTSENDGRFLSFRAGLGGYCDTKVVIAYDRNFDGDVAEVIAYDRILTEQERKGVENYLARKWKDGDFYAGADTLALGAGTVTLGGDGVLDLAGTHVTAAALAGTGAITNSSERSATLTVTGANSFRGTVGGSVKIVSAGGSADLLLAEGASLEAASGTTTLGVYTARPPADGLLWWMDASDASTVTTNAAGEVTQWTSKGGTVASFAKDGAFPMPTYTPAGSAGALNGNKPGVWFNGTGRMRLAANASAAPATTFVVFHTTAAGVNKGTSAGFYGYRDVDCGLRYWTGQGIQYADGCSPFSNADACYGNGARLPLGAYNTSGAAAFPADQTHVISGVAAAGRPTVAKVFVFGSYHPSTERCFIGWICESIAYSRILSDAERVQVENYLMAKWKGAGAIPAANTSVGGSVTVASGATLAASGGAALAFDTLSGGGAISGNVTVSGKFEVAVKPGGTTDTLTVAGNVMIGPDVYLQVFNPENIVPGVASTFLQATGIDGTFSGSNLVKPSRWRVGDTQAVIYRSNGLLVTLQ